MLQSTGRHCMAKKLDGVIEAVRYKNGQIEVVRAFERRGAAFSDRVLLTRAELVGRLKKGLKFSVGKRKEFLAGSFDFQDKALRLVDKNGQEVISTRSDAEHDELENAPMF